MKRIHTTPFWMSLAVAICPVVQANENPAPKSAPAAPAEVQKPANAAPAADALTGLQKHFETMNQAITEARTEAADVAGQRDAARKEALAIREAKQQLEGQLSDLRKQLEASNHEIWQWKDKAGVLEKKLGAGEQAFQKLATFRDEMDTAMKEFAVLKSGLADVRGELQAPAERVALKKELAELKTSKEEMAKKLDAETKANVEGKRLLAVSENFGKELKKAFEELKTSAKAQFEMLTKTQQERDALSKNLAATNEQLATARNEAKGLADTKAAMEKTLAANNEQLAKVSNEAKGLSDAKVATEKNLDATRNELTATRESLAMLQSEAAQLRSTVKPLAAEIQSAREQTAKATVAIQEASAAREKAEQGRLQVENQLKEVNGQLAAALEAQNGLKQLVTTKTGEIEGLRKKVEEMEAKLANAAPPTEGPKRESAAR